MSCRALSESLITPLELKMEEWKKVASQLDKDHSKGRSWAGQTLRHRPRAALIPASVSRVQEGQSRHQEEVLRHHQAAEEGEER